MSNKYQESSSWKRVARSGLSPLVGLLVTLGLSPNKITIIGTAIVVFGALLLARGYLTFSILIIAVGLIFDGLDGAVARVTSKATEFGAFLDSVLDRLAEGVLWIGLGLYLFIHTPWSFVGLGLCLVVLVLSFLVSYIRARAQGLGLDTPGGIGTRAERMVLLIVTLILLFLGVSYLALLVIGLIGVMCVVTIAQRMSLVFRHFSDKN